VRRNLESEPAQNVQNVSSCFVIKHVRPASTPRALFEAAWLNLADGVEVELTSEDPERPIEGALLPEGTAGWRAATAGPQTISLIWAVPIRLQRIRLVFEEPSQTRTQEFVLRASTRTGEREIVRQQFTFSPPTTTVEREEYVAELDEVARLQLEIIPAIDGGDAVATLKEWRTA
jgi:hypothetical protein